MSKLRPTPEASDVAAVRKEYDREVHELRTEIAWLRAALDKTSGAFGRLLLAFLAGALTSAFLAWLVWP